MRQFDNPPSNTTPSTASADTNEMHSIDLLDLVRRKFWLITFFAVIGTTLGILYFFKAPKTFESSAKIVVEENTTPRLNTTDGETFLTESPVEKYLEIIRSARVINPAIIAGNFDELKTFEDTENILYTLSHSDDHLIVKSADAKSLSSVINVSFVGKEEGECQQILEAIVDSFSDYIAESTNSVGGQNMETLTVAYKDYQDRLAAIDKELDELSQRPELMTWINSETGTPNQSQQIRMLLDDLHEVGRNRRSLQARLDTIDQIRERSGDNTDTETMMMDALSDLNESSFGAYVTTHRQFMELKIREQELLSEFGGQHPDLRSIRSQIEMVDNMRMQELNSLRGGKPGSNVDMNNLDFVQIFKDHIEGKIDVLKSEETNIQAAISKEQSALSEIAKDVSRFSELTIERGRLVEDMHRSYDRLSEMKALKEVKWREMEILGPASLPEQASPVLPIAVGGGLFLGSLFGFLFATLKDMAEKTFHSSDDIAALLGTRVMGHVNQFFKNRRPNSSQHRKAAPEVISLHDPTDSISESYRAIRTSLFFKAQQNGGKVIQVTSPIPGDGKSTTISNLAASIALTGRSVVLVDCDFRKPVQHKLFGLDNDKGMTSVIYGELEWQDAITPVVKDSLSVLPCGPIPGNPAELLTADYFPELIEDLRANFDFVLLDTPPLLAVTDPSIVSAHVDMLLMVIRIKNGVRTNAIRAKEILDSLNVNLAGVIVNGLRRKDQKTYNYGGRSGYGSGYGDYSRTYATRRSGKNSIKRPRPASGSGSKAKLASQAKMTKPKITQD